MCIRMICRSSGASNCSQLANSLDCGIKECFEVPLAMSCIEILIEYMTAGHESELVERGNFVFLEINEGVNLSVL